MTYEDAQAYLAAVVSGSEKPDPVRVAAAKALLPFQVRRTRSTLAAETKPREQRQAQKIRDEETARAEWCAKSAAIRARIGKTEEKNK